MSFALYICVLVILLAGIFVITFGSISGEWVPADSFTIALAIVAVLWPITLPLAIIIAAGYLIVYVVRGA